MFVDDDAAAEVPAAEAFAVEEGHGLFLVGLVGWCVVGCAECGGLCGV